MSIQEFIASQAKRVSDSIEFIERTARIKEQVDGIVAAIAEGAMPRLSRDKIDPDLYDALEERGVFGKKIGASARSTPKIAPKTIAKKRGLPFVEEKDDSHGATDSKQEVDKSDLDKLAKTIGVNTQRLHQLIQLCEEVDIDESLRNQYQKEYESLQIANAELYARKFELESRLAAATSIRTPGTSNGVSSAPTQKKAHRAAKKGKPEPRPRKLQLDEAMTPAPARLFPAAPPAPVKAARSPRVYANSDDDGDGKIFESGVPIVDEDVSDDDDDRAAVDDDTDLFQ